jgi:hypothetical protein
MDSGEWGSLGGAFLMIFLISFIDDKINPIKTQLVSYISTIFFFLALASLHNWWSKKEPWDKL